jgi:hypothetical protein
VRNPFDRAISIYYFRTRDGDRPPIDDFLAAFPSDLLTNSPFYRIDKDIAVDFVGHCETLNEDLAFVLRRLGLDAQLSLPYAKGHFRKDRTHYSKVLPGRSRALIEQVCADEIATFSYEWEEKEEERRRVAYHAIDEAVATGRWS